MDSNSVNHIHSRAYRISLIEIVVGSAYGGFTGGMVTLGILMFLGGGNFEIGLLNAIGSFAGLFSVFSVFFVQRVGNRKKVTLSTFIISRLIFGLILLLVILRATSPLMLIIVFVSSIFGSICGTVLLSWITSLIPQRVWGRYFSIRSILATTVGMFVPIIAGRILDHFKHLNRQTIGFSILLGVGILLSFISYFLLQKIPGEIRTKNNSQKYGSIHDVLSVPRKDKDFMAFAKFVFFFTFFNSFAGPFYMPHMINNLKMSFTRISLYGFIAGGIGLYFRHLWGRLADRYGPRPLLRNAMWGIFPLPLIWLFATPHFQLPIWVDAFISGIFWSGIDISLLILLLGLSSKEEKEAYFSAYTIVGSIAGLLGSFLGGLTAKLTNGFSFYFLGQHFVNYHIFFAISSLSRLWTMQLARKIPVKKTEKVEHFPGIIPIAYDELWKVLGGITRLSKSLFSYHLRKSKAENKDG